MAWTTAAIRTRTGGPFGAVIELRVEKKQLIPEIQRLLMASSHPVQERSVMDVAQRLALLADVPLFFRSSPTALASPQAGATIWGLVSPVLSSSRS